MRTAAICPTCATYINAACVIYNGEGLTNINVAPLDDLETIIQNINDNLVPIYGSGAPTNSAVYEGQIYIDNSTGDVYIATATGGGAGDWDELALQSAIPSTPSLDDVLTVGNKSTKSIFIQDLLVAPTQKVTIQPINVFIEDTSLDLQTAYNINNILVEDVNTGDQLQINIDNLQNQVIDFPDTSGKLALLTDIPTPAYKVYTATISQTGTTPPTVDYLLENTLSGSPTWGYNNVGMYTITLSLAWTNNKTIVFVNPGYLPQGFTVGWERNSSSTITIHVRDTAGNYTNGLLFKASVEVRVYN